MVDERGKKRSSNAEQHPEDGCLYTRCTGDDLEKHSVLLSSLKRGLAACKAAKHHDLVGPKLQIDRMFSESNIWTFGALLEQFLYSERPLVEAVLFRKVFAGELLANLEDAVLCRSTIFQAVNVDKPGGQFSCIGERDAFLKSAQTNLTPEWNDTSKWPDVQEELVPSAKLAQYRKNRAALISFLSRNPPSAISSHYRIGRSKIYKILKRARELHPDGRIFGFRACIPYARTKAYERTADYPTSPDGFSNSKAGYSGAFAKLLREHPSVLEDLRKYALRLPGVAHESRINSAAFHRRFLDLCRTDGKLKQTDYPFSSQGQARGSCDKLLVSLRQSDFARGAQATGGMPAFVRSKTGTGIASLVAATRPFELVIQDGHKVDALASVLIPHYSGDLIVPISRLSIEVVFEPVSHAILGYTSILKSGTDQHDAAEAVKHALKRWEPMQTQLEGVFYKPGAGFPSMYEELQGAAWDSMMVDNGSYYTTETFIGKVRDRVGCSLNFGPPGQFIRRYVIEGLFSVLERLGFQRLPSTTGSDPKDTRRIDAEQKAKQLPWQTLLYLIDVCLANYNATSLASLGGRSPLEYLSELYCGPDAPMIARTIPDLLPGQAEPGYLTIQVTVRGKQKEGRRPHIQYEKVIYTSELLASTAALIGRKLFIRVNISDLRSVELLSERGEGLGFLYAMDGWRNIKHTLQQRRLINQLISDKKLRRTSGEDWIEAFLNSESEKAAAEPKRRGVSKRGSTVAHVMHTTGAKPSEPSRPAKKPEDAPPPQLPPLPAGGGVSSSKPVKPKAYF